LEIYIRLGLQVGCDLVRFAYTNDHANRTFCYRVMIKNYFQYDELCQSCDCDRCQKVIQHINIGNRLHW